MTVFRDVTFLVAGPETERSRSVSPGYKRRTMDHKRVADTWERGSPYEQYVGRWSRQVAPLFLSWLDIPAGRTWLDVGCGTGALTATILDRCCPSSVVG